MVTIGDQTEWVKKGLEKLRYEYNIQPEEICIDIGSYKMEWANEIIKRYGCKVECFDALDDRAAWVNDGFLLMGGAFLYTSLYDKRGVREVKCFDISPYLDREIAVLKINIEGAEYELLNYIISKGLHKNIKNIQVQFHLIDGIDCQNLYKEIKEKLTNTHSLTWSYPFVWENWALN